MGKQMIEAPKKKAQAQLARRKAYEARMARYRQLLLRADRSKNPYNQRAANSIISPPNANAMAKSNPYGRKPTAKPTSNPYKSVGEKKNPYAASPKAQDVPRVVQPKIDAESVRLLGG